MTFGMQIRLWFRQASPPERRVVIAVVACLGLLALLTIVIAPRGADEGLQVGSSLPTAPVADVDTGAVAPAGTTPNGSGPAGGSSASGGGGFSATAGAPTTAAGGSSGTPATAPTTTPSTATTAAPLVESDRGITADTVRIGFLPAQVAGLDNAGFAVNVRDDAGEYAQALGDYANAQGGVIGRNVEVFVRKTDPVDQSDQAAACQAMAEDHKVFGVVDVGAISDTPYMDCIAVQNQIPYIHNTIWGTDWLARSKGLEVGYPAAIDRVSQTWVRDLQAMDWLPQGGVVGVIGDRCAATDALIDNVLVPLIKSAGVADVVVAKHDCDAQSVVGQPSSFPVRFRAAGVTHVFLAANFVSNTVFMSSAQSQGYRPEYTASDWWQAASDASAENYPPAQFDGAIAITSNGMLLEQSGKQPYPGYDRCNQVAVDAGLPPLKWQPTDQELFAFCDNFFLMIDGLNAAGPNPTRWDWAAAIQGLGEHASLIFGPSRFAAGKVTGSDTVFTARWSQDCKCFLAVTDARPAAA